jgi:RNA polymerase sigma-70 factor, ECF subfamily
MEKDKGERFDRTFGAYRVQIYAFFLGRTGCREEALDLVQETYARMWRSIERVPNEDRAERLWLFRTAKNLLTDHYRRTVRKSSISLAEKELPVRGGAEESLDLRCLLEAIGRLPAPRREILTMSVVGQMSSDEIGELLNRPAGTIRYELSKAREELAKEVDPR